MTKLTNNELDSLDAEFPDFDMFTQELKKAEENKIYVEQFKEKIKEKKIELNVSTDAEVKENLPDQDHNTYGTLERIRLDDIGVTTKGELVKTHVFDNVDVRTSIYGDLTFTKDEALSIVRTYAHLTTGARAAVPLNCSGAQCKFAADCIYQQLGAAPIGKKCLIEFDLLNYHFTQLVKQYNPEPDDHTSRMLIGELSELIVYEMRIARVLAEEDNAGMMGIRIKFSPDGDSMQEETAHWAWEIKERIMNRKSKLIEQLNKIFKKEESNSEEEDSYEKFVRKVSQEIDSVRIKNLQKIKDADFTEIKK